MISELVIWNGWQIPTYKHELDEWLHRNDDLDAEAYWCQDIEIDVKALKSGVIDPHVLLEDSGGLISEKSVILYGAEAWKAEQATYVVDTLAKMDCEVRVAMVYRGAKPPKGVIKHVTSEETRSLPIESVDELGEWIKTWLFGRGVIVSKEDALAAAVHCGHDIDKLVQGLMPVADGFEGRVDRDVLFRNLGDPGMVNAFELMGLMLDGNREAVKEQVLRLKSEHPIGLHAMLTKRFRAMTASAYNPNADLEPFGIHGGAKYYITKDAKKVGKSRLTKVMEVLGKYDHSFKGGSSIPAGEQFSMMTDTITMICGGLQEESAAILDDELMY